MTPDQIEIEIRHLATKEDVSEKIIASERSLRGAIDSTRNLIFGTYALMIVAIFVNHFWK